MNYGEFIELLHSAVCAVYEDQGYVSGFDLAPDEDGDIVDCLYIDILDVKDLGAIVFELCKLLHDKLEDDDYADEIMEAVKGFIGDVMVGEHLCWTRLYWPAISEDLVDDSII